MIICDASLAVKLVIREADSGLALAWYGAVSTEVAAPDLIAVEVSQAIVRLVNMRTISRETGRATFRTWRGLFDDGGIILHPTPVARLEAAVDLAIDLGHPVKDCIYLALAMDEGCELATCDAKFAAKARKLYRGVRLLSDYAAGPR